MLSPIGPSLLPRLDGGIRRPPFSGLRYRGIDVAVLDKDDRWRVVSNPAGGISVVVEISKDSGQVVFLERRIRKVYGSCHK
jgi:hypothetical protein